MICRGARGGVRHGVGPAADAIAPRPFAARHRVRPSSRSSLNTRAVEHDRLHPCQRVEVEQVGRHTAAATQLGHHRRPSRAARCWAPHVVELLSRGSGRWQSLQAALPMNSRGHFGAAVRRWFALTNAGTASRASTSCAGRCRTGVPGSTHQMDGFCKSISIISNGPGGAPRRRVAGGRRRCRIGRGQAQPVELVVREGVVPSSLGMNRACASAVAGDAQRVPCSTSPSNRPAHSIHSFRAGSPSVGVGRQVVAPGDSPDRPFARRRPATSVGVGEELRVVAIHAGDLPDLAHVARRSGDGIPADVLVKNGWPSSPPYRPGQVVEEFGAGRPWAAPSFLICDHSGRSRPSVAGRDHGTQRGGKDDDLETHVYDLEARQVVAHH